MVTTNSNPQRTPQTHLAEADQITGPGENLANLRTAALLPQQLLQSGEVIILLIKPSAWYILLESWRFLAGVVLALIIAVLLIGKGYDLWASKTDLIFLSVGIGTIRLVWQLLEWLSRIYVLTDRRVLRIKGVLRISVFETQLANVQHTVTLFSIRERLFGLGTVGFATAGTAVIEAAWDMVARPLEVHQVVVETLNRYR